MLTGDIFTSFLIVHDAPVRFVSDDAIFLADVNIRNGDSTIYYGSAERVSSAPQNVGPNYPCPVLEPYSNLGLQYIRLNSLYFKQSNFGDTTYIQMTGTLREAI